MQQKPELKKLNNSVITTDEKWYCRYCVSPEQTAQFYGARVCNHCGVDNQPELIYVMRLQGQGFYKIGITHDVPRRLSQLLTASPFDFDILAIYDAEYFDAPAVETERILHAIFRAKHYRREWYVLNHADVALLSDPERLFEVVWHYVARDEGYSA